MLVAVVGPVGLVAQGRVEGPEGRHLRRRLRVRQPRRHARAAEDLLQGVLVAGAGVHQDELRPVLREHLVVAAHGLGGEVGEEVVLDEARGGQQHHLHQREVHVPQHRLVDCLVEALEGLPVLVVPRALAGHRHLDLGAHEGEVGGDQAQVGQPRLAHHRRQLRRPRGVGGGAQAVQVHRVPAGLAQREVPLRLQVLTHPSPPPRPIRMGPWFL
mmetsp:Transcript_7233/g.10851  ORF Transcript_7233/g.10851 Transcript_7233/m.10851 type:complete len:214 (+) Transcript_7233:502-1143(+)